MYSTPSGSSTIGMVKTEMKTGRNTAATPSGRPYAPDLEIGIAQTQIIPGRENIACIQIEGKNREIRIDESIRKRELRNGISMRS
jgi:hypothetical protein